jgi:hypothetical protein
MIPTNQPPRKGKTLETVKISVVARDLEGRRRRGNRWNSDGFQGGETIFYTIIMVGKVKTFTTVQHKK